MVNTYKITGMTCSGCQATVKTLLMKVPGVENVQVDLESGEARIDMHHNIPTPALESALSSHSKYRLSEKPESTDIHHDFKNEAARSWFQTNKPVLLIFAYLVTTTMITARTSEGFLWWRWMNHFMAGFFLVFSFFKLLNLKGFADSYAAYDVLAKCWPGWGFVYAFLELGLGLAFLSGFKPFFTNALTFVLMSLSLIGVLQSVLNKRNIQCACLGAVFNLPMSTITILEDLLMIIMSGIMLVSML